MRDLFISQNHSIILEPKFYKIQITPLIIFLQTC